MNNGILRDKKELLKERKEKETGIVKAWPKSKGEYGLH
jgi:hypothetical protein